MANFREYDQRQGIFRELTPNELLEPEHPARILDNVVERLDLSRLYSQYADEGNRPYHPKMMLKVLFYSYMNGMMSCRKMWDGLKNRADYIFLSGDQVPDFRTINRFRSSLQEVLAPLFSQIVLMCVHLGMVDFTYLGIDGQKIQGNATFRKSLNKQRWREKAAAVEKGMKDLLARETSEDWSEEVRQKRVRTLAKQQERLQELEQVLGDEEEGPGINMTDPDAKTMKHKDGRKLPSYNHQSAVDGKLGVTVAVHTRTDAFDHGEHLFPLVDEAKRNTGGMYRNVLADSGFCDFERLEAAESRPEEYYMPDRMYEQGKNKREKRGEYGRSRFNVDADLNVTCPAGYLMRYRYSQLRDDGLTVRIYEGTQCQACHAKSKCTKAKKRRIGVDEREKYRNRMHAKLKSDSGREIYMKRQGIVEPVQGHDQKNLGWKQHHLRGIGKAALEFMLIRIGGNIRKMGKYRSREILSMV